MSAGEARTKPGETWVLATSWESTKVPVLANIIGMFVHPENGVVLAFEGYISDRGLVGSDRGLVGSDRGLVPRAGESDATAVGESDTIHSAGMGMGATAKLASARVGW